MTASAYAELLIQAYGHAIALALAKTEAKGADNLDNYWTKVLKAIRSKHAPVSARADGRLRPDVRSGGPACD